MNKRKLYIIIVFLVGLLIRTVFIANIPNALNVDEASAGYEAYSILNYGIDRNANTFPVFLVSWGSGQNVLLTYMIIPFIKLFGLTTLAVRLPMAIIGVISLVVFYLLLKKITNCESNLAIIGLTFLCICPWHIMKSRWGLESNLFPDLILIFIYLLIKGIEDKNKYIYYLSFVIAGITAYSYGTSYFFLPIFLIPTLIMLVKKQKINLKQAIISILIVGVISLPIILCVIINTFNLLQIQIGFITVPKLEVNRYKEITSIFSMNFINSSLNNFIESLKILLFQTDGLEWNSQKPFGLIYYFSIFFTVIGIIYCFKENKIIEKIYNYVINIWFVVAVLLTFICEPNINRLNIIMFPVIYYTVIGIYLVFDQKLIFKVLIGALYFLSFVCFIVNYAKQDWNEYFTFEAGLEEVFNYVDEIGDKQIHITNQIKEPYIYVLFYTKYDTRKFIDTVEYKDKYVEFRQVESFGNYKFEDIQDFEQDSNNVYIIKNENLENYDIQDENYKVDVLEKYTIVYVK